MRLVPLTLTVTQADIDESLRRIAAHSGEPYSSQCPVAVAAQRTFGYPHIRARKTGIHICDPNNQCLGTAIRSTLAYSVAIDTFDVYKTFIPATFPLFLNTST